ncbi:hypothetical protein MVLG_00092 [Microbotryum lychnidis-dioicae p1A1 Lamole]|uniref:J domain-containing protein n=1 Tax=Microbotryum lychnidis-dioicae (strain p1A1 Lamole / MvSl-1064) TaxID=683840 RepID=U5GY19_USTV1|nr:hypothetical protein MVLG_00092 [Microbotryum lychnidis-dioicae p1A1 Lamole]|eukprot:KDE09688.1 hypothetical protein MVLG_00092 [Microbotryum lychnidis-dioicae p1A1 Lamole]
MTSCPRLDRGSLSRLARDGDVVRRPALAIGSNLEPVTVSPLVNRTSFNQPRHSSAQLLRRPTFSDHSPPSNMGSTFPDYYAILGIEPSATPEQVKTAYKRKSLLCHPDRIPAGPEAEAKKKKATVEFQAVADAYYTLSDTSRRSNYDQLRSSRPSSSRTSNFDSSSSYFNFFNSARQSNTADAQDAYDDDKESDAGTQPDAEHVFGSVFEDMLRPEVNRHVPVWTWAGAASGAVLGFIAGNLPGAAVGGFAGSKLGAVRDAKGKAVYTVFKELGSDQKAQVLAALAAKVFGMAGIGGQGSR